MLYDLNGRAVFVKNNLLSMGEILHLAACFFSFSGWGCLCLLYRCLINVLIESHRGGRFRFMRERGFDNIVDGELSVICLSFMILNASLTELFKREVNKKHVITSFSEIWARRFHTPLNAVSSK